MSVNYRFISIVFIDNIKRNFRQLIVIYDVLFIFFFCFKINIII
jgi:hypothetical protein